MLTTPRVGVLPLYLQLYDDVMPETRAAFGPFLSQITEGLALRGLQVIQTPVCRVQHEVDAAVRQCEREQVDLLIVLHLAYSPSLESAEVLAAADLPLLLLDTTMDARFDQQVDPARIMFNHGIHGVMDLSCMLRRLGRPFQVVAGHVADPSVLDRAAAITRAAVAARALHSTRALRIGPTFAGMGDFAVPEEEVEHQIGMRVDEIDLDDLAPWVERVPDAAVAQEMAADRNAYLCTVPEDVHARSTRVGLGLRRLLEMEGYQAFSMNFMAFNRGAGPVSTVPFLEACKAMTRGIGYAGEGDVLTAALVGALARGFGDTTFTEIFCPDWAGQSLFLSHMGEVNPALATGRPHLFEYDYPFSAAQNPAKLACGLRPGPAVFVDMAPGPYDALSLIIAPVEMLEDTTDPRLSTTIRGWMRPAVPVPAFLEAYAQHGGTHHSALVYGATPEALTAFAHFAGLSVSVIK